MSVHAGTILHVAGNNVIDRIQSAGLGDVRVPIETIREVGNYLVVDKVPGEPDFTFTMEGYDVSTDLIAFLTGQIGALASGSAPGSGDPDGTEYRWEDVGPVNIASPWKDAATGSAGVIAAGHLVPGYHPTRLRYRFGVTDFATQEAELSGGAFYYAGRAPVEEFAVGDGAITDFVTSEPTVHYRRGGAVGTEFRDVFGVIVGKTLMIPDVDYTVAGGDGAPATISFTDAPANGARIRFAYFTTAAKAYPQTVHAATIVKPGAVRGRNIKIYLGEGGDRQRVGGVQTWELEATVEGDIEREMGSEEAVGRTINGTDTTGNMAVRAKDHAAFLALLSKVTGVADDEVFGFFNQNTIPMEVVIENPKTGQPLKTIVVDDAQFQPPGTPARVNTPTDFGFRWDSLNGTFREFKGARP
jgi:hypothetical protein